MKLFRGRRRDADIAEEIATHLSLMEDEYRRAGLSEAAARDAARRALGGELKARQAYTEQRRFAAADAFVQDVRFAVRLLLRNRGFAATAILVLGIGIGVNNMMFTLIYGSTLRGLPIARADRVVYITTFDKRFPDRPLSYPDFDDLRSHSRNFTGLAAFVSAPLSIGDQGRVPERLEGAYATAGALDLIGRSPILGRTFGTDEDRRGAGPVVVIDRTVWESRYAADPSILGRFVLVNGTPATVIGVMPAAAGFPSPAQVWLPLAHAPNLATERRDARTLRVFARLRDDLTVDDARADVESIIARVARENPDTSEGLAARVVPINQRFFGGLDNPNWRPFIAASILVVLVSCANAANLMIGRGVHRTREIAIRGSLGASRARVIGQFLVEAVVLAAGGGAVGLAISFAAARLFESAIPPQTLPYWLHYAMDWRVFAALVAVSLATVLVFGVVPAIQASRTDVNRTLRDGGRGTARSGSRRLTSAFLVAELGLSVVLLAQVFISYQVRDSRVDSQSAIDTPALLVASVTLPAAQYATPPARLSFYERLRGQLQSIAGVSAVTLASQLPLGGGVEQRVDIEDRPRADTEAAPSAFAMTIAPDYFSTLQVPLVKGREFSDQDGRPGSGHAIVNARFAERFFPDRDIIGRRFRVTAANAPVSEAPWLTVVGVASNIRQRNLIEPDPVVYLPLPASPGGTMALLVRSTLDPARAARVVREEVARIDPHLPLYRVMTMRQAIHDGSWNSRASHNLILSITVVSLALSLVGLYAVTVHAVGQRRQEIGIRMALGARADQVRRLILGRAAAQVALGLIVGLVGAIVWDSIFVSSVPGSNDPVGLRLMNATNLAAVSSFLLFMTFVACFVPLRRATRLDPVAVLRQE